MKMIHNIAVLKKLMGAIWGVTALLLSSQAMSAVTYSGRVKVTYLTITPNYVRITVSATSGQQPCASSSNQSNGFFFLPKDPQGQDTNGTPVEEPIDDYKTVYSAILSAMHTQKDIQVIALGCDSTGQQMTEVYGIYTYID